MAFSTSQASTATRSSLHSGSICAKARPHRLNRNLFESRSSSIDLDRVIVSAGDLVLELEFKREKAKASLEVKSVQGALPASRPSLEMGARASDSSVIPLHLDTDPVARIGADLGLDLDVLQDLDLDYATAGTAAGALASTDIDTRSDVTAGLQ